MQDALHSIRACLTEELNKRPSNMKLKVLVLSWTDGQQRATTKHWTAMDDAQAWRQLDDHVSSASIPVDWSTIHLRVDVLVDVQSITWGELKRRLANTKRNYFRKGIALDARFEQIFLEVELNANAMLLGPSEQACAQLNTDHFNRVGRAKYGESFSLNHDDDTPVWVFETCAVYWDSFSNSPLVLHQDGAFTGSRIQPELDPDSTLFLIEQGSQFLARQVLLNGRFVYGLFPCFDREVPSYNTLRHASTTYAMLEAWEQTRCDTLKEAIDRALMCLTREFIVSMPVPGVTPAQEFAFLVDVGQEIKLGGNAVAILALCKYTELTGETTYLPLAQKLAHGIAAMFNAQTGQFVHVLNYPDLSLKQAFRIIYYDGEASFALLRLYKLTRLPAYLTIVEKAFEHFISAGYEKEHDHWLSYCVNELTIYKPERKYFEFGVRNFNTYLDFVLQRITTFPTLLELMMAAHQMLQRMRGNPDLSGLLAQVDLNEFNRALHHRANYLRSGFFWPEWAMFFKNPARIAGGFFIRHHSFRVRIDDVEHYLSGLIAYRRMLLEQPVETPTKLPGGLPAELSAQLPVLEMTPPADLNGQINGAISPELLCDIKGGRLHRAAARQWQAMYAAALNSGVVLCPLSGSDTYRSLAVQVRIFLDRYEPDDSASKSDVRWQGRVWRLRNGKSACEVPGQDGHGWGLMLVVALDRDARVLSWLRQHALSFGFCWAHANQFAKLVYYAGDTMQQATGGDDVTNFSSFDGWTAEFISRATPGRWLRQPDDQWVATGLSAWGGSVQDGHVLVLAAKESDRGIRPTWLLHAGHRPRGVISTHETVQLLDNSGLSEVPFYQVENNTKALMDLAYAARANFKGRVIGVTGSAGKSTTVQMLSAGLSAYDPKVYATQHNANLPFGVAWNICQMDWSAQFGVFELAIGSMPENTRLARPDVAVITNIGPSHLEYHGNTSNIALKKSRIFMGVPQGGTAVICHDTEHVMRLIQEAQLQGLRVLTYGTHPEATLRVNDQTDWDGSIEVYTPSEVIELNLSAGGKHRVLNGLACLAVALALGLSLRRVAEQLERFEPLEGRGRFHQIKCDGKALAVIDESYNANPLSMKAAIEQAHASFRKGSYERHVLVLGDMLELGPKASDHHLDLLPSIIQNKPDLVVLCGSVCACLIEPLKQAAVSKVEHYPSIHELLAVYPGGFEEGDHILVKASNGVGLHRLISSFLSQSGS